MNITVEEVERIKGDFDAFINCAELMYTALGHPRNDFESFSDDFNRIVVNLAVGSDGQREIVVRLRHIFRNKIRSRSRLRRGLRDDELGAYRALIEEINREGDLGLSRSNIRSIVGRHKSFIIEYLSRMPPR